MNTQPFVSMNLLKDLDAALRKKFAKLGITPKGSPSSVKELCLTYLKALDRRISPVKRTVHISKELQAKISNLSIDEQQAIQNIRQDAEHGNDLHKYFSTTIVTDYEDMLFSDWGIIHLHLGTKLGKNPAFIKRTMNLLFVHATKNELYFIDVLDHDLINGFSNDALIKILHANWPHITTPNILVGIPEDHITNEQRAQMRKSGTASVVGLGDGRVISHIGGGYLQPIMLTLKLMNEIEALEYKIRANPLGYLSAIQRESKQQKTIFENAQTLLDVKLIDTKNGFEVIETITGCRLGGWEVEKNH